MQALTQVVSRKWTMLLFLFPCLCFAQGGHRISQVLVRGNNVAANVAPFAKVQVCVVNTGCDTAATVYADVDLTIPLTLPLTADASGNYNYYLASGCVDEQISAPGQGLMNLNNVCPNNGTGSNANIIATPQYRLFQQPNVGSQSVAGPTNITTDATGRNLFGPGAASFQSPNYSASTEVVSPQSLPFPNTAVYDTSVNANGIPTYNQFIDASAVSLYWNSNFNGTLRFNTGFNNGSIYNNTLTTRGNGQTGMYGDTENNFGGNDAVYRTVLVAGTGFLRPDGEGTWEKDRAFYWINHQEYGGVTTALGVDSLNNPIFRVTPDAGHFIEHSAEGRFLIDLSSAFAPAGNIHLIGPYDATFGQFIGDGSSNITSHYGTSTLTTLTGGADSLKYGADNTLCTSSGGWTDRNPYGTTNAQGTAGSLTNHKCIAVASSAGMSVGTLVFIGGSASNEEYTTVQQVVDGTHIRVNLKYQHGPGEAVNFGGGVGQAICMNADMLPAKTLEYNAQAQPLVQHLCYPIVATLTGNVAVVYTNSEVPFGNVEIRTNAYLSNVATVPATLTLTNTGNAITSVSTNANRYVGLPPPAITYSGFSVNPVITWLPDLVPGNLGHYLPHLVSGGTCTSGTCVGASATVQDTFSNAATIYPVALSRYITDPNVGCPPQSSSATANCPTNGYLGVHPTVAGWGATGHVIESTPNWNAYVHSQEHFEGSLYPAISGRSGSVMQTTFSGIANTVWHVLENNQDPRVYYGLATNGWEKPDPSLPPCPVVNKSDRNPASPCYSGDQLSYFAPVVEEYAGAYSVGHVWDLPPNNGSNPLGNQVATFPVGSLFVVQCTDNAYGWNYPARCNSASPAFDPFNFLQVALGHGSSTLAISIWPQDSAIHMDAPLVQFQDTTNTTHSKANDFSAITSYGFQGHTNAVMTQTDAGGGNYTWNWSQGAGGVSQFNFGGQVTFNGLGSIETIPNTGFQHLDFGNGARLEAKDRVQWGLSDRTGASLNATLQLGANNGVSPILVGDGTTGEMTVQSGSGAGGTMNAGSFKIASNTNNKIRLLYPGSTDFSVNLFTALPGATAVTTLTAGGQLGIQAAFTGSVPVTGTCNLTVVVGLITGTTGTCP